MHPATLLVIHLSHVSSHANTTHRQSNASSAGYGPRGLSAQRRLALASRSPYNLPARSHFLFDGSVILFPLAIRPLRRRGGSRLTLGYVRKTVRACGKKQAAGRVRVVRKCARVPGCKYMHYVLENVSIVARMERNYSMTLKMGLRGLGRWSA